MTCVENTYVQLITPPSTPSQRSKTPPASHPTTPFLPPHSLVFASPCPTPMSSPSRKRHKTMSSSASEPIPSEPVPSYVVPDLVIDGSSGEGGGQVLRLSLSLAAILSRHVRVTDIRGNRLVPGLQAQHVAAVNLVADVSNASLVDACEGSQAIELLTPRPRTDPAHLPFLAAVSTAGATALVLQAALPPALKFLPGGSTVAMRLTGGTTAMYAPPSDYVQKVLVPNLRLFGVDLRFDVVKHGFFPRGGGQIDVSFDKKGCQAVEGKDAVCVLNPIELTEKGTLLSIEGELVVSGYDYVVSGVVEEMALAAVKEITSQLGYVKVTAPFRRRHITIKEVSKTSTSGKCLCLTLFARFSNGSVMGSNVLWSEQQAAQRKDWAMLKKSRRMTYKDKLRFWRESVSSAATEAAKRLCDTIGTEAAVDEYMADQLVDPAGNEIGQ
ncbi:unnamed protein product [Chondrus crispus]|uniref:RNA 3'-terminal phosphate cyclase domain-containing protein n=1 Tax=Chondrus crispus TaxID=2769 RepID=R7QMG6_CHOCR|nr:unnamed protein product [Chondrus crispus]CDF38671.1 unnamed protein product [Chondrus crispus]|eukprot:XP_005718576.1 unnamed protein product [Chondrus crispus]